MFDVLTSFIAYLSCFWQNRRMQSNAGYSEIANNFQSFLLGIKYEISDYEKYCK